MSLVMIFVVDYIIHSTTCEQAYSGARNSGSVFDYACLRMLQMPFSGFKLKIFRAFDTKPPPPIFHKESATCILHGGFKGIKTVYSTDK